MCKKLVCLITLILLLGLSSTAPATTYYVSPSGNDNNPGTSPAQAWKTIDKVNTVAFSAGDSILFEGGQTFSGQFVFDNEAGTSTSPITVSSYGTGRATLSNPTMGVEGSPSTGLGIYDNAGFEINNLILVGPGNEGDRWSENVGVRLEADLGTAGARVDYIRIDNVEVSNYSGYGILIYGVGYSGFRDVAITNCVLHHIGKEGICSSASEWPMNQSSHNDFYIADNVMYDITGVGVRGPHSGSGINLSALDGALVEFNLAYSGGELCMAEGGGPLGIWCWETENIVFQFNEVHNWQTLGGDGGGFDLDGGTSYGIIQYNYSHDNFGGDLLMQFGRSRAAHDYIYRYNINANQCQLNNMGAITFYSDVAGDPYNVEVYNNTIYVGPDAQPGASAIAFWKWKGGKYTVNFRNNIFMAEAGKKLIHYTNASVGDITFQGNLYWQSNAPLVIDVAGTVYNSLDAWRTATGQEMLDGQPVGMEIGPQLVDVHSHPALGPHNLSNLTGYKLKSSSQCRDNGLDLLTLFGIDPGPNDFYGNAIPQGTPYDIGAHEYPGGGSAPAPDSTPPSAPTGLTATAVKSSQIDLDWADNGESDISHYSVKRSASTGSPYTQIISNLNASAYSDKSVMPQTTYYYVVSAVDTSSNESGDSAEASETTPAYAGVLIFSDGFESGDLATGGWTTTGSVSVTTEAAYTGTYGATIAKHATIKKELSTAGYTDIRIRYMRNTVNSQGGKFVWWDGSDIHAIEISAGDPWALMDIFCSTEADDNPDFSIFVHDKGPCPGCRTFLDVVEIWGVAGGPDTTPPTPDPMTWATPPYATGESSIAMVATTASDPSGVEYYFDETSGNPGGSDSGWQDSTSYTDTGLQAGTQYCYTVRARDKSPNQNTTADSSTECATTWEVCSASTTHVESIVCGVIPGSKGNKYGQVTVTIYDNCGDPVSAANVTGTFTGSYNETRSGTTNESGIAVITTTAQVKKPSYTFCVDSVTHATLTYAPGDNVETCDSY